MPIVSTGNPIPLSRGWTHQAVLSEIRVLLNELDNERISDINIRTHINVGLSNLAEILSSSNEPFYVDRWTGLLDLPALSIGVPNYIDLSTDIQLLYKIKSVSVPYYGACVELPLKTLETLCSQLNTQWHKSIAWCWNGSSVLIYIGKELLLTGVEYQNNPTPTEYPINNLTTLFVLSVYRQPLLDNLLPKDNIDSNFTTNIDFPDRHIRLLIVMVQKMCLEQLGKQVPVDLEQLIASMSSNLNRQTQQNEQEEQIKERTK